MKEEKIQELLKDLYNLKYVLKGNFDTYDAPVIQKDGKDKVESLIRSFLLDNRDETIATLEAKVFTYERIISNSNFAPMLNHSSTNQTTHHNSGNSKD